MEFIAVLPHAAGFYQAEEVKIAGKTKEALHNAAWAACVGSRYVGRILAKVDGSYVEVYRESGGWQVRDPHDVDELRKLRDAL